MQVTKLEQELRGQAAVVTGGGRGIGRAIAIKLGELGCNVVICSRTDKELQETKKLVEDKGVICGTVVADVSKEEDCRNLVRLAVDELGGINILVNRLRILENLLRGLRGYLK